MQLRNGHIAHTALLLDSKPCGGGVARAVLHTRADQILDMRRAIGLKIAVVIHFQIVGKGNLPGILAQIVGGLLP